MSDYTHADAMRDLERAVWSDTIKNRLLSRDALRAYIERLEAGCYVPGEVETLQAHIERLEAENERLTEQYEAEYERHLRGVESLQHQRDEWEAVARFLAGFNHDSTTAKQLLVTAQEAVRHE